MGREQTSSVRLGGRHFEPLPSVQTELVYPLLGFKHPYQAFRSFPGDLRRSSVQWTAKEKASHIHQFQSGFQVLRTCVHIILELLGDLKSGRLPTEARDPADLGSESYEAVELQDRRFIFARVRADIENS
jgi:hypothetical protein